MVSLLQNSANGAAQYIANDFTRTLDHIYKAYYTENGLPKIPSNTELKVIDSDASLLKMRSKVGYFGVVAGSVMTLMLKNIPYFGTPILVISGVAILALGLLSYDMGKIAENLNTFAQNRTTNSGNNIIAAFLSNPVVSRKKFNDAMLDAASKGTILARMLYDMYKVQIPK